MLEEREERGLQETDWTQAKGPQKGTLSGDKAPSSDRSERNSREHSVSSHCGGKEGVGIPTIGMVETSCSEPCPYNSPEVQHFNSEESSFSREEAREGEAGLRKIPGRILNAAALQKADYTPRASDTEDCSRVLILNHR